MPKRMLSEGIKRSAQIDQLSWFEEVVFYRLIVTADDYGRVDGRSILLRNDLFPTKENVTKKAVEDAVSRLASVGLLCRYTVSGTPYLFFPTWEKHQRLRAKKSKLPAPPANIGGHTSNDSLSETCLSNDGQMTDVCLLELEVEEELEEEELEEVVETLSNESVTRTHANGKKSIPPTVEEVAEYCRERNNGVDAQRFVDYYTANGWKVGKNPMKDWKAAVRTWESGSKKPTKTSGLSEQGTIDPMMRKAIERRQKGGGA